MISTPGAREARSRVQSSGKLHLSQTPDGRSGTLSCLTSHHDGDGSRRSGGFRRRAPPWRRRTSSGSETSRPSPKWKKAMGSPGGSSRPIAGREAECRRDEDERHARQVRQKWPRATSGRGASATASRRTPARRSRARSTIAPEVEPSKRGTFQVRGVEAIPSGAKIPASASTFRPFGDDAKAVEIENGAQSNSTTTGAWSLVPTSASTADRRARSASWRAREHVIEAPSDVALAHVRATVPTREEVRVVGIEDASDIDDSAREDALEEPTLLGQAGR